MSLPAICDPDQPRAGQDGMGRVLRNLFDGLGEWHCGWRTSQPHWSDWNLTLWGGAMTDGTLGQSLRLEKGWRSDGIGLKLYPSRWLSLTVVAGLSVYTSGSAAATAAGW